MGGSPTNQPGFGVFEPSKSNTDFMRISKSPVETESGIYGFDTYYSSTLLIVMAAYRKCFYRML